MQTTGKRKERENGKEKETACPRDRWVGEKQGDISGGRGALVINLHSINPNNEQFCNHVLRVINEK